MNHKTKAKIALLMHKATMNEIQLDGRRFRWGMISACTPWWAQVIIIAFLLLAVYGAIKLP